MKLKKNLDDFSITGIGQVSSVIEAKEYVEFVYFASNLKDYHLAKITSKKGIASGLTLRLMRCLDIESADAEKLANALIDEYNFNWGQRAATRILRTYQTQGKSVKAVKSDLQYSGFTKEDIDSAKCIIKNKNPEVYEKIKNVKLLKY